MDAIDKAKLTRRSRSRALTMTTACALVLGACVNPAFRNTVGQFGQVTKVTTTAQNERLATVTANERERIRAGLVRDRVELRIDPVCAGRLAEDAVSNGAQPSAAAAEPVARPPCRIVGLGGVPIEQPPEFAHIIALNGALAQYSESLIALAADRSQDEAGFTAALSALASSLGGLDTAIRSAAGAEAGDAGARLGPVAALVAELGNLYFAHQRNRVLKRVIREADPFVQEAVRLLGEADNRLRFNERVRLARSLDSAETAVADARNRSAAELRAAQDQLFALVDAYNFHGRSLHDYAAIGEAHRRLREAAESGASAAELRAAIEAILHLAGTAHEAVTGLSTQSSGSSNNAN